MQNYHENFKSNALLANVFKNSYSEIDLYFDIS